MQLWYVRWMITFVSAATATKRNRVCFLPKVVAALHRWFIKVNASDFRGIADHDLQKDPM